MALLRGNFSYLGVEHIVGKRGGEGIHQLTLADLDDGGRTLWAFSLKCKEPDNVVKGDKYFIELQVKPGSFSGRDYLEALAILAKPATIAPKASAAVVRGAGT